MGSDEGVVTLKARALAPLAAAFALAAASCGSSSRTSHVSLTASGADKLLDTPVGLRVIGLRPREPVVVRAESRDGSGTRWVSEARFIADGDGVVDPSRASPRAGDYHGVHPQGLLWSMHPLNGPSEAVFFPVQRNVLVTLTVSASGKQLAARTIRRRLENPNVVSRALVPAKDGVYGRYFAPAGTRRPGRPSVLLIGGSEGGIGEEVEAMLLASHGYPALAVAYFRETGLPKTFRAIPLEYFARALHWFRRQPEADARRVVVYGASRGSEAALLVAASFPELVHGVIALSPSNVALGSYPGCTGPAWTLGGRPIWYQCRSGPRPAPRSAELPVQRIHVPLLLVCGGADRVWLSCPMAHAIERRRAFNGDVLLAFPEGGHGLDLPVPNIPIWIGDLEGTTPQANPVDRERIWARILRFIASTSPGSS